MKHFLIVVLVAATTQTLIAQHQMCGTDELSYKMYRDFPELRSVMENNRAYLHQFTSEYTAAAKLRGGNDSLYSIPVVFHVIHMYGAENVSDEQIMSGLYVLNRNFALQHPDTGSIVADFKPIAANCDIEFRLAHKDPDGNCTSGINRIASTLTKVGDHTVKNLIHWDPTKYLNVYVVKSIANLAGHCLMPDQAAAKPEWDGIVIDDSYLGNIGTSTESSSVVMAHEAGHYLNLFHIWGGNNVPGYFYQPVGQAGNCAIGDGVQDTPETIGWSNCNLNNTSCGNTVDNVQNAMDYSYCNWMFTQGQRQRMRAALNSPVAGRNNLITLANHSATGISMTSVCKADFVMNKNIVCAFDTVWFSDKSIGPATTWLWNFGDGQTATQQNPFHVYDAAGDYFVNLTAGNANGSLTSVSQMIRINGDGVYPFFVQDFENINSMSNSGLVSTNDNTTLNFELSNTNQGYNSNRSAVLRMNDTTAAYSGKTILAASAIDLQGTGLPSFSFKYACSQKKLNVDDVLEVFISTDCGKTWQSKGKRTGANLRTANAAQVSSSWAPTDSTEWKTYSFQLTTQQAVSRFMFRIEYTNYYGNTLYIDNINLNESAYTALEDAKQASSIDVIPNPTQEKVLVNGVKGITKYTLTDCNGIFIARGQCTNDLELDFSPMPAGVYLLHMQTDFSNQVHKIVKF
ncbi:MAG: PKD domain-containing protein [Chitinophagales bacterium]|nr:PKD domain-containing protein [Chitinophagales bacterium]